MEYNSQGESVDSFDEKTRFSVSANGEEYRLFGVIVDLVQKSVVNTGVCPLAFGDCSFGKRFSGARPYLAREHREIKGFPDCFFVNEDFVICIDQAQINASEPRSNYENGDEYRVFLANHKNLLEKEEYGKLEECLAEEGILFRKENLEKSLLHVLNSKLPKIAGYKKAARDYIASGDNLVAQGEDLSKTMEAWLLIEDVTPCTSFEAFEAAFSSDRVLSALEGCEELAGLIYVHHPFLTRAPQSVSDIAFIHNDLEARKQLRSLRTCK